MHLLFIFEGYSTMYIYLMMLLLGTIVDLVAMEGHQIAREKIEKKCTTETIAEIQHILKQKSLTYQIKEKLHRNDALFYHKGHQCNAVLWSYLFNKSLLNEFQTKLSVTTLTQIIEQLHDDYIDMVPGKFLNRNDNNTIIYGNRYLKKSSFNSVEDQNKWDQLSRDAELIFEMEDIDPVCA